MSLPLAILSSIALMVESTEASPFNWIEVSKRATSEVTKTTTHSASTKTAQVKASATETRFSNKPTTVKKTTTKAATSKASSANPSSITSISSAIISPASSAAPTSAVPPLMVPAASAAGSSFAAIPSTTSAASNSGNTSSGVSGGAIGGIIAAIVIIAAGAAAYFIVRRRKNSKNARNNRQISEKPDPFTMGFGSDQAFQKPEQQYQHQYGVTPNISVTSPTSPTSYTPYSTSNTQFHDANNHIISSESMMSAPPQQYQPQLQQTQQFQPQYYNNDRIPEPITAHQADYNNASMAATAVGVAAGVTTALTPQPSQQQLQQPTQSVKQQPLPAPTQAGSVGVFIVGATYTPTLSDEIDIQTGDHVEVLVEYDDGWCQGINLSRGNAKGVFPKHCVDYSAGTSTSPTPSSTNEVDRVKRVSSMYIA